jgi:hypothetical protein
VTKSGPFSIDMQWFSTDINEQTVTTNVQRINFDACFGAAVYAKKKVSEYQLFLAKHLDYIHISCTIS